MRATLGVRVPRSRVGPSMCREYAATVAISMCRYPLTALLFFSGITPVYAVMVAVLKDPEDPTTMSLIFANQTEDDILLKAELDELCNNHPTRLKVRPCEGDLLAYKRSNQ